MGRSKLLEIAKDYNRAVNILKSNKTEPQIFSIDGDLGKNYGTAAYYPDLDLLRMIVGNGEIKIPGDAIHSLKLILDELDC